MLALNQTSPRSVGTRITVDHVYTCGCSISPVRAKPIRPSCSSIHACAERRNSAARQGPSLIAENLRTLAESAYGFPAAPASSDTVA